MKRAAWLGVLGLCVSVAAACGRGPDTEGAADPNDDIDIEQTAVVNETGCLTSKEGRFVLTSLESGGATATELYQLVGNEEELRQHIGREVRITGDAEPAQVAELSDTATPAPAPAGTGGTGARQQTGGAEVTTETRTRLETRQLRVATVMPTGDECPAAAPAR